MRIAAFCIAPVALAVLLTPTAAQPVDTAMILHPGDIIEFQPLDDHALRFGGTVNDSTGASVTLIGFPDVLKLLDFPMPAGCQAASESCSVFPVATPVTATVRADIAAPAAFDFTCGVHTDMIARQFTVEPIATPAAPPRKLIITTNESFQWVLREDVVLNKDHAGHN